MLIYPAIDLQEGVCVRLALGRFEDATQYGDPFAQLADFERGGASWTHIVDLDGAKAREPRQHDLIARLARATKMRIQSGGGVRDRAHVEALLAAGVARVVVGSAAVRRPKDVRTWIESFGVERICCAFDVRPRGEDFEVATEGWTAGSGAGLLEALALYPAGALRHVLVTDISRDGILAGPNLALIELLRSARPDLDVQASGGVAGLGDLPALRARGAAGVIIGRALYERKFSLEDALAS
ncbi:MAG: 1-(5-phosphoribosyl)-5-[(5-phosphoribosylamino)methylideneamino] imidazole-4-carboxamide isomerase [Hyphomonadaceae bacterium]